MHPILEMLIFNASSRPLFLNKRTDLFRLIGGFVRSLEDYRKTIGYSSKTLDLLRKGLTSKCNYMIISRKLSGLLPPNPIVLEEHGIERVQELTYLGILLSSNLTWSKYIINKCNKARRLLGLIFRRFGSASSCETMRNSISATLDLT